jgi:hypothetical protein
MTKNLAAARAAFDKAADELRAQMDQLQRFPQEFPVNTVLTFTKQYPVAENAFLHGAPDGAYIVDGNGTPTRNYTYSAVRTEAGWFTTAQRDRTAGSPSWAELVEFIGDSPCAIAEAWREIPVAPDGVAELVAPAITDDEKEELRKALLKVLADGRRKRNTPEYVSKKLVEAIFDEDAPLP